MKLKTKTKSYFYKTLIFISILTVLTSCSRKKNKWLNRNYHAMTTYYNILYHGNIALEQGKTQVNENYEDNYWETLPVERLANTEEEIKYGEMVEVPPAVMPQRPKPKKKEDAKSSRKTTDKKERSVEDAFSSFNNTGSANQNQGQGRNQNQGMNQSQGGMNQGQGGNRNQGMNQSQGGMNQGQGGNRNQGMNQSQGGMNQGQGGNRNQGMNQPQGGMNQSQGGNRNQGSGGLRGGGGSQMTAQTQSSLSGNFRGNDDNNALAAGNERQDISFDDAFEAAEEKAAKGIQK